MGSERGGRWSGEWVVWEGGGGVVSRQIYISI